MVDRTPDDEKFRGLVLLVAELSEGDEEFGATKLTTRFPRAVEVARGIEWELAKHPEFGVYKPQFDVARRCISAMSPCRDPFSGLRPQNGLFTCLRLNWSKPSSLSFRAGISP